MKLVQLAAALFAFAFTEEAIAAPKIVRVTGVVTAISQTELSLEESNGAQDKIVLAPNWVVSISKPIAVDQIAPGSYIGTTNYAKSDGTGRSVEVHVSPPGIKGPGVDFVMDAALGTTMTNGVVSTVVKSEGGRVLSVNFGTGVRTITVPPETPIVLNRPGERAMIKVGQTLKVTTFTADNGEVRQFLTIGENGAPPPQ